MVWNLACTLKSSTNFLVNFDYIPLRVIEKDLMPFFGKSRSVVCICRPNDCVAVGNLRLATYSSPYDGCASKVRQLPGLGSSQVELSSWFEPPDIHLILSYSTPDGSVCMTSALIAGQVGSKIASLLAKHQVSLLPTSLTGPQSLEMHYTCVSFMNVYNKEITR